MTKPNLKSLLAIASGLAVAMPMTTVAVRAVAASSRAWSRSRRHDASAAMSPASGGAA